MKIDRCDDDKVLTDIGRESESKGDINDRKKMVIDPKG